MPPVRYGATVKSVDDTAAKKVPGFIKAVTLDDKTGTTTGWVVAVANTYANAKKAADALKVTYDGAAAGRYLAHLFRQPVRDTLRRDRGRRRRGRSQIRRDASDVAGRRFRPPSRRRHDGAGGAGGEGRRQTGQGHLQPRKRHDHGLLAAADVPENQGGSGRRRQADRDESRRGLGLADQT